MHWHAYAEAAWFLCACLLIGAGIGILRSLLGHG